MIEPILPDTEEMRIVELASYHLQNTDTEEDFDQLSTLVAQFFKCPIALITVIDSKRQWFKGKTGTTETGNSRELSFCGHTINQDEVMVVEDATNDKRFFDNPFVTGDFNIRFYAGAPIVSTDGFKLGTICIYDTKTGKLSKRDRNALMLFSKQVTKLLTLRKKNIQLHRQAEEIITFRSEIFARYIQSQETDRKEIAYNLHEDFAQAVAASLLLLQMTDVKEQKSAGLISEAIVQLKDVLVNMRNLSYTITPHFPDGMQSDQLLNDFIEKIGASFPFKITVASSGEAKKSSTETTVCAIRIIEQWLQLLLKKKNLRHLYITIIYKTHLTLTFEDDDISETMANRKNEVFESIIYDRTQAQGGTVELSYADSGRNKLKISLPLTL